MIKQRGFTAIEIATTLTLLIFLAGFLLKAHKLIYIVEISRLEQQCLEIIVAAELYYANYNYLPGDDPNVAERWNRAVLYNGNGDRMLNDNPFNPSDNSENRKAWGHLRAAGLITGNSNDLSNPQHVFGGLIGISGIVTVKPEIYISLKDVPKDALNELHNRNYKKILLNVTEYVTLSK